MKVPAAACILWPEGPALLLGSLLLVLAATGLYLLFPAFQTSPDWYTVAVLLLFMGGIFVLSKVIDRLTNAGSRTLFTLALRSLRTRLRCIVYFGSRGIVKWRLRSRRESADTGASNIVLSKRQRRATGEIVTLERGRPSIGATTGASASQAIEANRRLVTGRRV